MIFLAIAQVMGRFIPVIQYQLAPTTGILHYAFYESKSVHKEECRKPLKVLVVLYIGWMKKIFAKVYPFTSGITLLV